MHQGIVFSKEGEIPTLQEETEMTNRGVGCQKLSVEGGVLGFGRGKFPGEKGEGWRHKEVVKEQYPHESRMH